MYDFCMTFPYAALLALGGLMGFLVKGSVPSLMGGLGSALILAIAGQRSISYYHQVQSCACKGPVLAQVCKYATKADTLGKEQVTCGAA